MHGDLCKHLGIDSSTDHPDTVSVDRVLIRLCLICVYVRAVQKVLVTLKQSVYIIVEGYATLMHSLKLYAPRMR